MGFVAFFSMLMAHCITRSVAYDDMRGSACKATSIALEQIPETELEWGGQISLRLVCDEGFDHPLNFNPEEGTDKITCKGTTNRWEPDFLPDCNAEIIPKAGKKCPNGTTPVRTPIGSKCRGCSIGQYLDVENEPVCKPCAKGYYQNKPMSTQCTICPYLKNKTKAVWNKVKQVSKNRLFHVLGCPIVKTLPNGTELVLASPDQYADEMKHLLKQRKDSIRNIDGNPSRGTVLDKYELLHIVLLAVAAVQCVKTYFMGI